MSAERMVFTIWALGTDWPEHVTCEGCRDV